MVERSVCPHCSFRNFSVSKSCARCEKPLQTPQVEPVAVEGALARPVARVRPERAERAEPASRRTTAPLPGSAVPPPVPGARPLSMAEGPPASASAAEAATRIGPLQSTPPSPPRERPPAPRVPAAKAAEPIASTAPPPRASRPLSPASTWQHALASTIDVAAVLAVALGWALFEMAIKSGGWPSEQASFLEALALWLHLYAHTARRMAVLALAFGAGHTMFGVRTGKTLGRMATGLLLVGTGSGRPTKGGTWSATLWHTVGGTLSVLGFGAGHFWLLVDQQRRTWANLLGRTLVVQNARRQGAARQ